MDTWSTISCGDRTGCAGPADGRFSIADIATVETAMGGVAALN